MGHGAGQKKLRAQDTLWRRHWTVENKSHYVRDETMREDCCQIHKGNAAQAMAALRNLLLATLRFRG